MAKLSTVLVALVTTRAENQEKLKRMEEMASSWERDEALRVAGLREAEKVAADAAKECAKYGGSRAPLPLIQRANALQEAARERREALAAWRRETKGRRQAAARQVGWAKEDVSRYG